MADIPIYQRTREEVGIPKLAEMLCKDLEDIANGDGLVPRSIAVGVREKALKSEALLTQRRNE